MNSCFSLHWKDSESSNSALELFALNCHFHAFSFIRVLPLPHPSPPPFLIFFFLQTVPISPHWYHQHSPSSDCRNRRSNCFAAQNGWVALDKTMSKNLLWTCLYQFALGTTGTFAGATPPLAMLRKKAVQRDLIRQCFLTVNANHLTCYFLQRWIKTDHFGISPDFVRILVRIHRSVLWTLFFVITVLKVIYCWKAGTVVVLV